MKNFKQNSEEINWPWVESPFFPELIKTENLTEEQKEIATHFNEKGYVILDLGLTDEQIEECKAEVDRLNQKEDANIQHSRYHYSKGKRIFEAWKESEILKHLAIHPKVMDTLRMLYKREPYPFQTITFNYGSNQPLHSDTIHFDSMPQRWLTASWVALEDMTDQNGSLIYVPESHKLPIFDFYDLKLKCAGFDDQFESYAEYEEFIRQLVAVKKLNTEPLVCKKGQALIWAANLIHGGDIVRDENSTRYSQVTHYYYDECDVYYSPMFSEVWKGKYAVKDLESKNIREHKIEK